MNGILDKRWRGGGQRADDSWGGRTPPRDRMAALAAIGASYLVDTLLLWLFCLAGTVGPLVPLLYGSAALLHVLAFLVLHAIGVSTRLTGPSMALGQMVYAIALQLASIAVANRIVTFFLANMFVIFGFGTLWISLRQALALWLGACISVAVALSLPEHADLGIAAPSTTESILVGVSFASFLLRSIGLGYFAATLRARMLRRAQSLAQAMDRAEHLAIHDALTGTLNRRGIVPAIEEQIALTARNGPPVCLAMLDMDRFKSVNDGFGHPAGDRVLKGIARQIARTIRRSDKLGRYGGEEFVLLLPGTDLDRGVRLLERIRLKIAETAWPGLPEDMRLTVSAGIARIGPSDTPADVVTRADQALYRAKHQGRNRVCRDDETVEP